MAIYLVLLVSAALVPATAADVGGEALPDGVTPEGHAGRKLLARYRCNARKDMAIFDNNYAYFPTGYLKDAKAKSSTDCCNKCINNSKCWQVPARMPLEAAEQQLLLHCCRRRCRLRCLRRCCWCCRCRCRRCRRLLRCY